MPWLGRILSEVFSALPAQSQLVQTNLIAHLLLMECQHLWWESFVPRGRMWLGVTEEGLHCKEGRILSSDWSIKLPISKYRWNYLTWYKDPYLLKISCIATWTHVLWFSEVWTDTKKLLLHQLPSAADENGKKMLDCCYLIPSRFNNLLTALWLSWTLLILLIERTLLESANALLLTSIIIAFKLMLQNLCLV